MKIFKRTMLIIISVLVALSAFALFYIQLPKFGKAPSGERLERISKSPHYKDGSFVNLSPTSMLAEGFSYAKIMYNFFFKKHPDLIPKEKLPSVFTNLHKLAADTDVLVWFGHSSYFMQVDGLTFLVDPVFSENASPVPGSNKAFAGSNVYTADDMPKIDYLLISHDHYDHLDYETVTALRDKVRYVVCGLGVGSHLEHWGYPTNRIIEKDWNETVDLDNGLKIYTLPARHFSGRKFKRNNTLWLSFLLETPIRKIFIGGDSGYDNHFAEIGKRFGTIDLAILENGQYNVAWQAIHCLPEETLKAAAELNAKRLMPVHSSKFALGMHAWYEPLSEISRLNSQSNLPLVTPMIGEQVNLNDTTQSFSEWWKELK